jgi:MarR family transcriptional regulator, transcriptional regulator for hemolysin
MLAQHDRFSEALVYLLKDWRGALDARLRPFGLSQARWQVLLKLLRASEALGQCDLAHRVGIEPASLVRLLDALEKEGLVARESAPDDRRAKRVSLTAEGRVLSQRLAGIADGLKAELLDTLSAAELEQVTVILERLRDRIGSLDASC